MAPWNPWKELPGNSWLHATRLADLKKQQLSSPQEFSPELCVLCAVWFMDSWMHCGTHFALGYDGFIFDLRLVQGYREVRFVKLSTQLVLLQLLVVV